MRIAISGHSGCGNTTASHNVAQAVGVPVLNYTFRDLAKDLHIPFEQIHADASHNFVYDYLTDLVCIRSSEAHDIVVGNRLAAWLVEADLRVWLYASIEARAARINKRETQVGQGYEAVLYKTLRRDEQNRNRYLQVYGIDISDHTDLDITINTERLTAEQVSSLIVAAVQWVQANSLKRENLHLPRIRKIIGKNLGISEKKLFDPDFSIDLQQLYLNYRHQSIS